MHIPQTEVILRHEGTELARITLPPGEYVIGRNPDVDIRAATPLLSRRHARLTINYDHFLLEDLGSSNGTFVNDQPIAEATRLFPNQPVRLGNVTVEFRRERAPDDPSVSLAPAQQTIRRFLPEEVLAGKRYAIGKVVAQGGMGAILDAQQSAMKRRVAMKVMLDSAEPADVARFVEEAQVTGQLEHPNIVPVHELGVDENDQLFYTMKMVRGITLKKVVELIAEGVEATVRKYPLPALLTVFQKVCDAIAFAHSKGVIHRDLKPENIMLDDFGVVLVMDWGLAKVVGTRSAKDGTRNDEVRRSTVHSARAAEVEFASTLAGSIMGTPQYMAPEQARGEIDALDARTDIYALGAILYTILTLRPPVTGANVREVIDKVARGEIEPLQGGAKSTSPPATAAPEARRGHGRSGLRPSLSIPDSLAAVVGKAMAFDPAQRYPSVADLQRDLTAYQDGFATSAEKAGWRRQTLLALKRHKTVAIATALVLLAGLGFGTKAIVEGRRAEREAARANQSLRDLKATAPDLLALAASEAALQRYESALKKCDAALALDPALRPAYWRRGWLLLAQEQWPEAVAALRLAQARDPANRVGAAVLPLVEKMGAASGAARYDIALIKPLYDQLSALGALGEAAPLVPHLKLGNDARLALVRERVERWLGKPPGSGLTPPAVYLQKGQLFVRLDGLVLGSLDPLRGLPIDQLFVDGCGLTSLEPLRGMRLALLYASDNDIEDLGPIEGMPLKTLGLRGTRIRDLSPLHGMPLQYLSLVRCHELTDLRPLTGLPLEELFVSNCPIADFLALRGMPLRKLEAGGTGFADGRVLTGAPLAALDVMSTALKDASTLVGLPLRSLRMPPIGDCTPLLRIPTLESLETATKTEKLLPLRAHPGLKQIKNNADPYRPVAEFWAAYDAQQAAGKK